MWIAFNYNLKKRMNQTSLLAALTICFQYLCAIIGLPRISIFLSFIVILLSGFSIIEYKLQINANFLFIIVCIIMLFLLSFMRVSDNKVTIDYLLRFFLYDMVALLIGMQKINIEETIRLVTIIGTLGLPLVIFGSTLQMNAGNAMGYAYSCVPIIITSVFSTKYGRMYAVCSWVNIVVIVIKLIPIAPRGVWVVTVTFLAFIVFRKLCSGKSINRRFLVLTILLVSGFIAGLWVISNFENVIFMVNQFAKTKLNLEVYAFDKYLRYLSQGKVLNGRDLVWEKAIRLICEKPLAGWGIGYFETALDGHHCHNIVLQSLCENGIIFGVLSVFYILSAVTEVFKTAVMGEYSSFIWLLMIFCCGIEILLFSSAYWIYTPFWFFMGAFIRYQTDNKRGRI